MFRSEKIQLKKEHRKFDVDEWANFSKLQEISFPTKCFPLSIVAAQALIALYRIKYCHAPLSSCTKQHLQALRELEKEIDSAIKTNGWQKSGAFVRLSQRSPKDGQQEQEENDASKIINGREDLPENANDALVEFYRATSTQLRVFSGESAMNLICSSERVFVDLLLALEVLDEGKAKEREEEKNKRRRKGSAGGGGGGGGEEDGEMIVDVEKNSNNNSNEDRPLWDTMVAVRQWDDRVRDDREFRLFVCKNQLTAASQYNHLCVFSYLHDNPDLVKQIEAFLFSYWNDNIKERLEGYASDYIVDVAIFFPEQEEEKEAAAGAKPAIDAIVVEINPFHTTTGAALFDWRHDADVLYNGPYSLRIKSEPLENAEDLLEVILREWVSSSSRKKNKKNNNKKKGGAAALKEEEEEEEEESDDEEDDNKMMRDGFASSMKKMENWWRKQDEFDSSTAARGGGGGGGIGGGGGGGGGGGRKLDLGSMILSAARWLLKK